ncbi:FAD-dependent oxidoreductase [Rhizoctonia solani AG-3 Rhs1AP]|uniref:FAD-dependent oxidoreductase n=1 Tax=Rhizoctonia solani AG-3 Rhs1AP TaxID=1086054 RepID=A0A0A1UKX1_9AGAM|nr:FAD-dependent oxidoreductase [Rhizoctonia solani AG-3 Rhs1AP]
MDASTLPVSLNSDNDVFAAFNQSSPRTAPLPTPNPTKSFWLDSEAATNPLGHVGSTGSLPEVADIVIIGSGITGCSAAYHLSQLFQRSGGKKNQSVVILEARDFCSGATGRNGGHLTAATVHDFQQRVEIHGVDEALRAVALEKHTVASIIDFLDETPGAPKGVDLVRGGHVSLLFTPAEIEAARKDIEEATKAGMDLAGVEYLEPDVTKQRFRVELPAVYSPGHTLWPSKLVTMLYQHAKGDGIAKSWLSSATSWFSPSAPSSFSLNLFTHAPVNSVEPISQDSTHRWLVVTQRGSIKARYVVHATNAYASHLLPQLAGPAKGIVPTRAQCMAARGSIEAHKWPVVGWGGNEGYEYWFARPPERFDEKTLVILGGGRETVVPNHEINIADDSSLNPVVSQSLHNFLPRLYPGDFEESEPEMEWTGIMGFTRSRDPMVGQVYSDTGKPLAGQYIAAGYSGHGMPRAFACAEVVAQMIHADILGGEWSLPDWFPRHLLTRSSETGTH